MTSDTLHLHRTSLRPFRGGPGVDAADLLASGGPELLDFILANGLGPLWGSLLDTAAEPLRMSPDTRTALRICRIKSAALYALPTRTLRRVTEALHRAGGAYAVFKGAYLREVLYPTPVLRPMEDIDVLVPEPERHRAIACLACAGMTPRVSEKDLSHELAMVDGSVTVDLRWRLFRPGRSRVELAPALLDHRREHLDIWTLDDSAALLVMLVHPAFVKHVNSDAAKLVRLVELDRLLRLRDPDWDWILPVVGDAGLRTAAWRALYWLCTFFDTPLPAQAMAKLRPSRLHGAYRRSWIDRRLPAGLQGIPLLVQGAFTLALHDRPADGLRAVAAMLRARMQSRRLHREIRCMLKLVGSAGVPKRSDGTSPD